MNHQDRINTIIALEKLETPTEFDEIIVCKIKNVVHNKLQNWHNSHWHKKAEKNLEYSKYGLL